MEEKVLTYAIKEGVWAALFVSLYFYQLRESRRLQNDARSREDKLTNFISDITKQFENLARQYEMISRDVSEIKEEIRRVR